MDEENVGVVKKIMEKGFGFLTIKGRSKDLFFHATDVVGGNFAQLREGDEVSYEGIEDSPKGEKAYKVRLLIK